MINIYLPIYERKGDPDLNPIHWYYLFDDCLDTILVLSSCVSADLIIQIFKHSFDVVVLYLSQTIIAAMYQLPVTMFQLY